MIMMHGWGCEHGTLNLFERVGREAHEVFNLDLPGFGKSDDPPVPWGDEEYTAMLESFVEKLGIEKPIVLGHSFGGRIAIKFASRNPVEKLILVDAAGIKRKSLKKSISLACYKFARKSLPMILGHKTADPIIDKYRKKRSSADYSNSSPMMRKVMTLLRDIRRDMPLITAPTLLLWGEADTATPMKDAHLMNRLIKDSTLVSFPGAGHYSFIDNPFQSAAVLRRFINPGPDIMTNQ